MNLDVIYPHRFVFSPTLSREGGNLARHACFTQLLFSTSAINMNQYQPLFDPIAPMDVIPLQMAQTSMMSGSKILAEILRIVIEILLAQNLPEGFLRNLRLVSKQFHGLFTPLLYRHIILTPRIVLSLVSSEATLAPYKLQLATDLRMYTKQVTLNRELPTEQLRSVFERLKHLQEVT